ncbi:MAG: phenylacetate--CoA ligase [Clostridia bacterium]|nr:phenylacetate--CoA ligase [Clostridia bacterium]
MIWNKEIECASRADIREIQLRKLQETVKRCYDNVPFYQKKLDALNVKPEDIKTLADAAKLPFTTKADFRDNYPYGLFAVPLKEVRRIHASSGTTGKPIVGGYTKNDINSWAECIARIAAAAGVTDEDIAQISFGYGLFTGALGLHFGLDRLGAMVIPISSGNSEKQLMMMKDLGTTLLVSTPSYAIYLSEVAQKLGYTKEDFKLRVGMFGGEGHTEEMRKLIEERWGILVTENYGLTEVGGPGVSGECYMKCGQHINEDFFLCEIIDPDTGEVLPYGEKGEMVITTLSKEAMPILRYRTRDITRLIDEPCKCGRTSLRMEKIQGRSDDMLIIKGVNVFPSQVETVLLTIPGVGPHYQLVVTRNSSFADVLEVRVELTDESLLDNFTALEQLNASVRAKLKTVLGIDAKVTLVNPQTIERTAGKAKHVIDMRNK